MLHYLNSLGCISNVTKQNAGQNIVNGFEEHKVLKGVIVMKNEKVKLLFLNKSAFCNNISTMSLTMHFWIPFGI